MAHILPDSELRAWCEHASPLGHRCQWCATPASTAPLTSGWICPGCRHGYSPQVTECRHCPQPSLTEPCP